MTRVSRGITLNKIGFGTPKHCSSPWKNKKMGVFWGSISSIPSFGQVWGEKWEFVALLFYFRSTAALLRPLFLHHLVFFKCEPAKKTRPQNHDSKRNNNIFSNYIDPRKCIKKMVNFSMFLTFDPKSWAMGKHD